MQYTVAVVGGGPIGCFIAGKLAEKDIDVAVFEEHKEIGLPLHCAGLITPRVLSYVSFSSDRVVLNRIKGARIHSPLGHILSIGGDKIHAIAIDRVMFDRYMMDYAVRSGVDFFLDNRVDSAFISNENIKIKTSKGVEASSRFLIGADGASSKIRQIFDFPQPLEYLRCIGMHISDVSFNPDFVEIFLGSNIAPGFFAWVIPINPSGTEVRIGLCTRRDAMYSPRYYIDRLLFHPSIQENIKDSTILEFTGGILPLGPLKKTVFSNILLVGDAAAQVKPTSGGGIYPGLICAKNCVDTISKTVNLSNPISIKKSLLEYHTSWMRDIGGELSFGMRLRRIFMKLSDKQIEYILKKMDNPAIIETISKHGDIDHPSKLVKALIRKHPFILTSLIPHLL